MLWVLRCILLVGKVPQISKPLKIKGSSWPTLDGCSFKGHRASQVTGAAGRLAMLSAGLGSGDIPFGSCVGLGKPLPLPSTIKRPMSFWSPHTLKFCSMCCKGAILSSVTIQWMRSLRNYIIQTHILALLCDLGKLSYSMLLSPYLQNSKNWGTYRCYFNPALGIERDNSSDWSMVNTTHTSYVHAHYLLFLSIQVTFSYLG